MNNSSENNNSSANQFLKKDSGKTKSNAIEIPSVSLPKGGGAIKGIDEKFSVNAVNGTASFSIPIPVSQARGVTPNLSLSYNSGGGNGVFGLGWSLGISSIKRKTNKKLPEYFDSIDSDTYLFSEAEDLVPEFKKDENGYFEKDPNDNYIINEKNSPDGFYRIRYYRPRIEGLFARIERWTNIASGEIKWRIITKDNITTLYGWSGSSRLSDPQNNLKIFEWMPEFVFDDKGNCAIYRYKHEDSLGFNPGLLHNRNRIENGNLKYTNIYLEKILYGNKIPYDKFGDAYPADSSFMFQTIFDYGTLLPGDAVDTINQWDFRNDDFSEYKSGFEIRTTRLCKRVLLFHYFEELPEGSVLVKSLNLNYDTSIENGFTFLTSLSSFGYIRKPDGTYTSKKLPDLEFEYQKHEWNNDVKFINADNLIHSPVGLDEQLYQFTDLYNEGLNGILTEQANGWYYKHNLGNGKFEHAKLVSPKPSFSGLGRQLQLADLDADGGKQLVSYDSEPKGFFELDDENKWQPFRYFDALPNINLRDPNTRMIDLNGDGIADVLISEDNVFTWYESEGRKGIQNIHKNYIGDDEEKGPRIIFADLEQSIYLSDMSGDGLMDIVRIRNGEVCYWPNLGYGKFGAKVSMDNAPLFDHPDSFNPMYIKLADIDGSGTSDIIYLGKNNFNCWLNLSGNSFHTIPYVIESFPEVNNQSKITVTDLLGNGVACIVWSSSLEKDAVKPLKYIDLMSSKKPHIMTSYKNNLGKEVYMEYTPSTRFYIEDKLAGNPWITKLHFPVHCVSKSEIHDKISGHRFVTAYKYHHGYYDHPEGEFRGFGMVEQTDSEHFEDWVKGNSSNIVDNELHREPVVSKSWFHTGAFLGKERILNQFAREYWYEEMQRKGYPVSHGEMNLPEAQVIPAPGLFSNDTYELNPTEWREALRSCKGMPLRSEIFAYDAPGDNPTQAQLIKQLTPYNVSTHNCVIELLQPKGNNNHAVFIVKESEAITYSYERKIDDPRIAHTLNIKLDEYGNVLESASVVYPRTSVQIDNSLPQITKDEQLKTSIIYTQNSFTNDVIGNDVYRQRLPSEVKTFELKGVNATSGNYYKLSDFNDILSDDKSTEVEYYDLAEPAVGVTQRRLIEHVRSVYYKDDLTGSLSLHSIESKALSYENYQLAYSPELLTDIFGPINLPVSKINDSLMEEGKFTHSENDANWWIRSGTVQYIKGTESVIDAKNRFFMPVSYTDPYGAVTRVKFFGNYNFFIEETVDALQNKQTVLEFNFRTLTPQKMQDANMNISETIVDELGLPKAMAVMGKGTEADYLSGLFEYHTDDDINLITSFFNKSTFTYFPVDDVAGQLLQKATARFVYDFDIYKSSGGKKPAVVASILREEHYSVNQNSPLQISFEYSNGLGKVAMKKVQAEPGIAKKVIVNSDNTYSVTEINTSNSAPKLLRWLGTGKTILNNKGNPVKQYEPYFSVTCQYEDFKELVESGVTPVLYYDALGRLIKTDMPDATFTKVEFDSWKQVIYDQNDTVENSEWYKKRTDSSRPDYINDSKEHSAAVKAYAHYNTPTQHHFDTLRRPVLQIENNGKDELGNDRLYYTKAVLDVEGNIRNVIDARNNAVMSYKYDMLGNMVYQDSMDAGKRWLLHNAVNNPLRTWDERSHEFQYFYDNLHRPTESIVIGGDGDEPLNNTFERIFYGESEIDPEQKNLRGQVYKHFDTGGLIETPEYDFKGQPKSNKRILFKDYKTVANWTDSNLTDALETDEFVFITETDALGRITKQTAPDGSVITPGYNEAGLLSSESVHHLNPDVNSTYIIDIDYNEKGQRNKIIYGNGVTTEYNYDSETFRLKNLVTKRQDNSLLQDLHYIYDAVGNITHIEDKAIPTVFFNNMRIEPANEYTYDSLYRLIEATGRENDAALSFDSKDNWNDAAYMHRYNSGDPMAMRNYTQSYVYDEVGNILQMNHSAGSQNSWNRDYTYDTVTNRLLSTKVGTESYLYPHHPQHGFITAMPHLEDIGWNFKEEVIRTVRQRVNNGGTPETTYYQYDGQGQRIRKITENQADEGITPAVKDERIYISGYELYKKTSTGLRRTSLSLLEKEHRFVMIETRNEIDDGTEEFLVRYQHHNHLGSANLELNENAEVISYEEYHPYGTTAYQAKNSAIRAAAKRYRYTGMERDEETGLEYHSARYYLPWLGRWCSADPIGIGDGVNVYVYGRGNPIGLVDTSGRQSNAPEFIVVKWWDNTSYDKRQLRGALFVKVGKKNYIEPAEKKANKDKENIQSVIDMDESTRLKGWKERVKQNKENLIMIEKDLQSKKQSIENSPSGVLYIDKSSDGYIPNFNTTNAEYEKIKADVASYVRNQTLSPGLTPQDKLILSEGLSSWDAYATKIGKSNNNMSSVMSKDPYLLPTIEIDLPKNLNVTFATNSAILDENGKKQLEALYINLMIIPDLKVTLIGHTDSIGSDEANLELSKQRATASKNYLVEMGISADRISIDWKGESLPIANNETEAGRALNRRIEVIQN
ncbi:MAG: OmpA family protein [Ignavibacteria bacterium]|nr:OmpA family protein [Ignavibacteria bacterium]